MGRRFVMADIHGMHKALVQCLERAGFNREEDELIQLGDITDRGPDVYECVEELMTIKSLIKIRGNHDDWFLSWITTGNHPSPQSGRSSIVSYTNKCSNLTTSLGDLTGFTEIKIPEAHIEFFKTQLPYYKDAYNNIFVHGGFDRTQYLHEQDPEDLWWDRDFWAGAMSFGAMQKGLVYHDGGDADVKRFRILEPHNNVFLGHTPTMLWNKTEPMHAGVVWNLDTGAGVGGKLTIMEIDTKEYWQSDLVTDLYKK